VTRETGTTGPGEGRRGSRRSKTEDGSPRGRPLSHLAAGHPALWSRSRTPGWPGTGADEEGGAAAEVEW